MQPDEQSGATEQFPLPISATASALLTAVEEKLCFKLALTRHWWTKSSLVYFAILCEQMSQKINSWAYIDPLPFHSPISTVDIGGVTVWLLPAAYCHSRVHVTLGVLSSKLIQLQLLLLKMQRCSQRPSQLFPTNLYLVIFVYRFWPNISPPEPWTIRLGHSHANPRGVRRWWVPWSQAVRISVSSLKRRAVSFAMTELCS